MRNQAASCDFGPFGIFLLIALIHLNICSVKLSIEKYDEQERQKAKWSNQNECGTMCGTKKNGMNRMK